jgi:hypothetical protein
LLFAYAVVNSSIVKCVHYSCASAILVILLIVIPQKTVESSKYIDTHHRHRSVYTHSTQYSTHTLIT